MFTFSKLFSFFQWLVGFFKSESKQGLHIEFVGVSVKIISICIYLFSFTCFLKNLFGEEWDH